MSYTKCFVAGRGTYPPCRVKTIANVVAAISILVRLWRIPNKLQDA
jgi:hypothetical protein